RRPCDIRRPRRDLHRRRHRRRLGPRDPAGVPSRRHDAGRMNDIPLRRNRDFVLLQVGQALSTIGSQSSSIAYPLLVLATTHSPAKAGVVGFANIAPYAIFALFAGVAADRWDRKQVMIAMDTVRVLAMVSIVVVYALGKLTFAQIAIVAFVEGSAFVFFNVAEVGALRSSRRGSRPSRSPGRRSAARSSASAARCRSSRTRSRTSSPSSR